MASPQDMKYNQRILFAAYSVPDNLNRGFAKEFGHCLLLPWDIKISWQRSPFDVCQETTKSMKGLEESTLVKLLCLCKPLPCNVTDMMDMPGRPASRTDPHPRSLPPPTKTPAWNNSKAITPSFPQKIEDMRLKTNKETRSTPKIFVMFVVDEALCHF